MDTKQQIIGDGLYCDECAQHTAKPLSPVGKHTSLLALLFSNHRS